MYVCVSKITLCQKVLKARSICLNIYFLIAIEASVMLDWQKVGDSLIDIEVRIGLRISGIVKELRRKGDRSWNFITDYITARHRGII